MAEPLDLGAIQARIDAARRDVLIVPTGAPAQLIVGPGGGKGKVLGTIRVDLRTELPLVDLWNHAHDDLSALVAELRLTWAEIQRLTRLVDGLDAVREAAERWADRHPDIQEALDDLHAGSGDAG